MLGGYTDCVCVERESARSHDAVLGYVARVEPRQYNERIQNTCSSQRPSPRSPRVAPRHPRPVRKHTEHELDAGPQVNVSKGNKDACSSSARTNYACADQCLRAARLPSRPFSPAGPGTIRQRPPAKGYSESASWTGSRRRPLPPAAVGPGR